MDRLFSRSRRKNVKIPKVQEDKRHIDHARSCRNELELLLEKDLVKCRKHFLNRGTCWFHDNINRRLAETKLRQGGNTPGLFLVRESNFAAGDFVLSFVHSDSLYGHFPIEFVSDATYCLEKNLSVHGLDELLRVYTEKAAPDAGVISVQRGLEGQPPPPTSLKYGYTNLLHKAICSDPDQAVIILHHAHCPDVDSKDQDGSSCLHLAVKSGNEDIVRLLLERGVAVEAIDGHGHTPLQRACQLNQPTIAEMLLVEGSANPQSRHKATANVALHEAAQRGHTECVKVLLKHSFAAWIRNDELKTPYELAMMGGHTETANYIDSYQPPAPKSKRADWLHGPIDRKRAVLLLESSPGAGAHSGLFLVRQSSRAAGNYVLSLRFGGKVKHYEVINEHNVAYHIDNGPLLASLEHIVDYYARHADGLECRLTVAITPDEGVKPVTQEDTDDDYLGSHIITGINEEGHTLYVEAAAHHLQRKSSLPTAPPPPPPLFQGRGKHPVLLRPESISLGFELGQGEYGSVLRGVWTSDRGEKVAVAIKTLNEAYTESGRASFLQEAEVMVRLDHPCLVSLIGVSEGPPIMLVQELVDLGALLDFLLDYPDKIDVNKDLNLWAAQVASGMLYLERQGFVHRDLATRNILLATKQQAKVGDFGLSRAVEDDSDFYRATKGGRWPIKWYAPESVNYGTFSHASDVWSYGVTLWEMFTLGDQPYDDMKGAEVLTLLESGKRLPQPECCSQDVYALMLQCWQYRPPDRPTFSHLLDFFNKRCSQASNIVVDNPYGNIYM